MQKTLKGILSKFRSLPFTAWSLTCFYSFPQSMEAIRLVLVCWIVFLPLSFRYNNPQRPTTCKWELRFTNAGQVLVTIITSDQPNLKADYCKLCPFQLGMGWGHLQLKKKQGILMYVCPAQGSKSCRVPMSTRVLLGAIKPSHTHTHTSGRPFGVTPLILHSPECKSNSDLRCFEVSPNVWVTKHGEILSSEIFLGNKYIALWLAINQFFPNRLGMQ